jgi:hypothetical protein
MEGKKTSGTHITSFKVVMDFSFMEKKLPFELYVCKLPEMVLSQAIIFAFNK